MKLEIKEEQPEFKPFVLTFTVESLQEAKAWHRLFNCIPLYRVLGFPEQDIQEDIVQVCPKAYTRVEYTEFAKRLKEEIAKL